MAAFDPHRRKLLRAIAALGLTPCAALGAEPLAVVMSATTRQRGLSRDKLRRIFLAQPTDDDDGRRFIPINLSPTSGSRVRFDRAVLELTPEDVARYWIDQRLRGNKPPRTAPTIEICRAAVQELPGAVAYLPVSQVGALRVLAIDGRSPGDSGYALS